MPTADLRTSFRAVLSTLALPVMIFGATYAVAMVAVAALTSPERFPVRLGQDNIVRLGDLEQEQEKLLKRQAELMKARDEIESQVPTPVLHQVRSISANQSPVGSALSGIHDIIDSFTIGKFAGIDLSHVSFSSETNVVTIAGEARDSRDRAVQVLASFVDSLRSSGYFAAVSEPEYAAHTGDNGLNVTPFTITLQLHSKANG